MFSPVIPSSGLVGWRFLQTTYNAQFEAFSQSSQLSRTSDYFAENIGKVVSAEELVSDRRLLEVALGAFGLQDDINNRFFIQKILEEGTTNDDSLANRFADARYVALAEAFGFGVGETRGIETEGFAEDLIEKFNRNSFEVAAGEQDDSMRIALFAQRTLSDVVGDDSSEDAKWFTIMGQPPLRELFEKALGLPQAFGQIDIEQQLVVFKERSTSVFGSSDLSQFTASEAVDDLVTQYLARAQIASIGTGASSSSIALQLLQS